MMANNPYPGVDAHLNSFLLQPDGGWESFHAEHVVKIRTALDPALPDNYYAIAEKSLQIGGYGTETPSRTRPDVSVYRVGEGNLGAVAEAATPTQVFPIPEFDLEFDLTAVNIYRTRHGKVPGVLVTRIELLSPANKPGGSHAAAYWSKRQDTINHGIHVVELDYLHTTKPIMPSIPSYPAREPDATPYYVLVNDPHLAGGDNSAALLYSVAVDSPLPRFALPLAEADEIVFDLQAAYHATVTGARIFGMLADYAAPPIDAETFTADDQKRIAALTYAAEA
ncbi:MAG: DUF4058 family protein [Chloroflexota bacterium]